MRVSTELAYPLKQAYIPVSDTLFSMIVESFFIKGIAHNSYLLGDSSACAIVDPRRDVDLYLAAAKALNMTITHVLETHLHADFVSGHLELSEATGAEIYAPRAGRCAFTHTALSDGDAFRIEDIAVRVLETPGHTPEHVTYVVKDTDRGSEPACVFCGDTLFVGDVGRPDLFPGRATELAAQLYDSLHAKLLALPDFCEVYPAHGAGSLCGRAMGAKRSSTIGYEKLYNDSLKILDKDAFIDRLTTNMPPAPDHFRRCSEINRRGPPLLAELPEPPLLDPRSFKKLADEETTVVVDSRSYDAFGGQHIPGAYNIDLGGNFATFAGWILPPDKDLLLVSDPPARSRDAVTWLRRVGLDDVVGALDGRMANWVNEGLPTSHVHQLSPERFNRRITHGDPMILVDARAPDEYAKTHIDGAINIPAPELRTRYRELDPSNQITIICRTGHRSSIGASLLKQRGFDVVNVAGGMTGYSAAGYAPRCPMCSAPHGPRFLGHTMA
jgi:glyoxylase-like metal-dependent hydrolase (beta-lactamase superfamily II)/rhodanese-related sulfurtransferase